MNIDAVNPDTSDYLVQASSELHGFLENRLSELADRITGLWKDGYAVEDVNGPWSDDYNYFAKGAPVMICGRGRSKWRSMHYHTQFDNYAMEDADLFRAVSEIYLSILLNYDKQLVLCLDFGKTHNAFLQSVDDKLLYACSAEAEEFYRCAEQCMNNAKKLYEYLNRAERSDMARQRRDKAEECCKMMLEVSAFITEKFRALDPEDNVIFVCEQYQKNIAALSSIEEYLLQMDYDGAYDSIGDLFGASTALKFSEQVYRYWCLDAFDGSRRELYWGSNLAEQPLDVALLYKMVSEAGRSDVEHEQACMSIERLRRKETEKYEYVIRDKEDDLRELAARFDEITDYIEESFF